MIFYFTGTGNSWAVANTLAEAISEKLYSMAGELERAGTEGLLHYELGEQELLGFVYPVYAWGPPHIVQEFVRRLEISGDRQSPDGRPFVFSITTCGAEEGRTTQILAHALQQKGLPLNAGFTLVMPNNYIIGADVDTKEAQKQKLQEASDRLEEFARILRQRETGVFQLIPGSFAGMKSAAVHKLFQRYGRTTKYFSVTDHCNGCGLCAGICPAASITMEETNDAPVWHGTCEQCFACIHRCPQRAIQYGKGTGGKGRYVHPDYGSTDRISLDHVK